MSEERLVEIETKIAYHEQTRQTARRQFYCFALEVISVFCYPDMPELKIED